MFVNDVGQRSSLESVFKSSMQPKQRKGEESDGKEGGSAIFKASGKAAVTLELKEQVFDQMAFFVSVPICVSWVLRRYTAGDNDNSAA